MHLWRERLNRWFLPLAKRSPLSPNQISTLGAAMNVTGAILMALAARNPHLFLMVPILVGIAGLLDAFDGIVARARQLESAFGDYLDHFLDRVSDLAIMAGWLIGTGVRVEIGMPALVAIMLNGYSGTQIEASFRERTYEGLGRAEFVLVMVSFPIFAFVLADLGQMGMRYSGCTIPEWLTLLLGFGACVGIGTRIRKAHQLDR